MSKITKVIKRWNLVFVAAAVILWVLPMMWLAADAIRVSVEVSQHVWEWKLTNEQ